MKKAATLFAFILAVTVANAQFPQLGEDANSKIINTMFVLKKNLSNDLTLYECSGFRYTYRLMLRSVKKTLF